MLGKVNKLKHLQMVLVTFIMASTSIAIYWKYSNNTPKADISNLIQIAQTQNFTVQVQANGVVQAVRKINLSPKDVGKIAQLAVDEGDSVVQGQLVARMESEQFQAQVNQYRALLAKAEANLAEKRAGSRPEDISEAQARVAIAQAEVADARTKLNRATQELKRNSYLAQEGAISQNQFEEAVSKQHSANAGYWAATARLKQQNQILEKLQNGTRKEEIAQVEADVAQATAQLQFYQSQLANTFIRAPFAGIITRRFAQEGDFVTPTTSASASDGATSTSIVELSFGLEVEAKVTEASIARIKTGQRVKIRTDAYQGKTFEGRVRLIAPRAVQENNVTSFRVKVALNTGQNKLKSMMNVKLTFLADQIENAVVVPLAAIITRKDGQTGLLVPDENNQAHFRSVTVGATSGDKIQILQGVSAGDRILLNPPPGQIIPGVDTVGF